MMLVNRKQQPVPQEALQQPHKSSITKFNLGGLFKKKINSKTASIDAVTTSNVQAPQELAHTEYTTQPASKVYSTTPPNGLTNGTEEHVEKAPDHPLAATLASLPNIFSAEDRYTSFTADCISLQNSDMTSHCEEMEDDFDSKDAIETELVDFFNPDLEESLHDYKNGGYHPVQIGDIYKSSNCEYQVVRKLGWGHFSTVWLARSTNKNGSFVALKIVKSSPNYHEAAEDEIQILKLLGSGAPEDMLESFNGDEGQNHIMKLHDNFEIAGPHGTHICMVFEVLGENILNLIYKSKNTRSREISTPYETPSIIPVELIKKIVSQVFASIDYMHRRGVIHTDLKPENILVVNNENLTDTSVVSYKKTHSLVQPSKPISSTLDNDIQVKIADLGNATYTNVHFTNQIQTRQYRSPEIILKYKSWGSSTDLWSIGCIIFELITGDFLFDPHEGANFDKDEDHMAQIIELLGGFPSVEYLMDCKLSSKFFVSNVATGKLELRNIKQLKYWSLEDVLVEKYKFQRDDVNTKLIADLILKCLRFDLDTRYDSRSLLQHPWLQKDPLYDATALATLPNNHDDLPGYTSCWEAESE